MEPGLIELSKFLFPIEAPEAQAGVRGASIFPSKYIDFRNIHEKATRNMSCVFKHKLIIQNDVLKYHIHVLFPKTWSAGTVIPCVKHNVSVT